MTAAGRYVAIEAAISGAINAVLSIAFALALFGGRVAVPAGDLLFDALPQSFMVTLMAVIVPTLLTRRRMRGGKVATVAPMGLALPRPAVLRGLLAAVVIAPLAWSVHRVLLTPGATVDLAPVLVAKAVYGALLGAGCTALAVRSVLGERAVREG